MKAWYDLNQEEQEKRSLHSAVFFAILAVIFLGWGFVNLSQEKAKIAACTATTTGYVVSEMKASRFRLQSFVTADYEVNGKVYHTEGRCGSDYGLFENPAGEPVIVHYNPSDPEQSYASYAPESSGRTYIFIFAAVFGLASPLFVWQAKHVRKNGAIMKK